MNPSRASHGFLLGLLFALPASCGSAHAATVWTDADGDGLPDTGTFPTSTGSTVTVDVWIDSESFTWTNFIVFVNRGSNIDAAGGGYYISSTDGVNFPVDTFTNPEATGLGGIFYDNHGLERIGYIGARPRVPGVFCLSPIIDPEPYGEFSHLGTQSGYSLFGTSDNTCYDATPSTASLLVSWGTLKALYR